MADAIPYRITHDLAKFAAVLLPQIPASETRTALIEAVQAFLDEHASPPFTLALERLDLSGGDPGYRLINPDGHVILTQEEGDHEIQRKASFSTIADAEAYLDESTTIDPIALAAGDYCIAAPHGVGDDDEALRLAKTLGFDVFYSMGWAYFTKGPRSSSSTQSWSKGYENTVAASMAALASVDPDEVEAPAPDLPDGYRITETDWGSFALYGPGNVLLNDAFGSRAAAVESARRSDANVKRHAD